MARENQIDNQATLQRCVELANSGGVKSALRSGMEFWGGNPACRRHGHIFVHLAQAPPMLSHFASWTFLESGFDQGPL